AWFTLAGAIALARADAGVDITLDPTVMANGNGRGGPAHLGKGQVLQPWARGTFAGPDGRAAGGSGPAAPGGTEPAAPGGTEPAAPGGTEPAAPGGAEPVAPGGAEPVAPGGREQGAPLPPGKIWVCKLGWWEGAPWDVRAYALGHPDYPCDPTLQQLYDGAEFEAYQALGVWSVKAAADEGELPLALPAPGG